MNFEKPKSPSPKEQAKIETERALHDGELIKGGAEYKVDSEGNKFFDVTGDQIEEAREEMNDQKNKEGKEPPDPKQKESEHIIIRPEREEELIREYMSIDHVKEFFHRKARNFMELAGGRARNYSDKYIEWLDKTGKQSSPEAEKQFKNKSREKFEKYNEIINQIRDGNLSEALKEIENISDNCTEWDNERKKVVHNNSGNLKELRAMSIALTNEINKKRGEPVPAASDEELQDYFQELMKQWGGEDEDSERWLTEAIKGKDYEAMADQIDTSISSTLFRLQYVEDGGMSIINYIKENLSNGEDPAVYLQEELNNLRRFREFLFEKNRKNRMINSEQDPATSNQEKEESENKPENEYESNNEKESHDSEKMKAYEKELSEVDRMADGVGYGIEDGIKEAVAALRVFGVITDQSCEGHIEEEDGLPFPWVRICAPEPENWEDSSDEERDVLEKKWMLENSKQQEIVMNLLEDFYKERNVESDVRLGFEKHGIFGAFNLRSSGVGNMEKLSSEEKKEKFKLYKKEMDDFTEFLKNKYFSS